MDAFWTILSENSDPDGIRFVSTLEAKDYPFYAIQVLLKILVVMMEIMKRSIVMKSF